MLGLQYVCSHLPSDDKMLNKNVDETAEWCFKNDIVTYKLSSTITKNASKCRQHVNNGILLKQISIEKLCDIEFSLKLHVKFH